MIKYAVFNILNRFQTYSNSIDCMATTFDVSLCKFVFTMLRVQIFLCSFGALQFIFLKILLLPPPSPHEINWSVPNQLISQFDNHAQFVKAVCLAGYASCKVEIFLKYNRNVSSFYILKAISPHIHTIRGVYRMCGPPNKLTACTDCA